MKKLFSAALAAIMALSLSVSAFAADSGENAVVPISAPAGGETVVIAPAPNAISVVINGKAVSFTDAAPAIVDGRTQAPFRAVTEALGAAVEYENDVITATFPDGRVETLTIGSKTLTVKTAEGEKTTEMDVAPYIDRTTGRTYVPVRYIGEAAGYTVTWDGTTRTAALTDWDAFEKDADAGFAIFNKMMTEATSATATAGKAYKSDDSITVSAAFDGMESVEPLKLSLNGSSVTKGTAASGSYTLGLKLGGYESMLAASDAESLALIKSLDGTKLDYAMNENADIYLRSALITVLTGGTVPESGWLELPLGELMSELGVDMKAVISGAESGSFTMGKLLRTMFEDGKLAGMLGVDPYTAAELYAEMYEGMFGDKCMTETKSGSSVTYTCKTDEKSLFAGMLASGAVTEEEIAEAGMKLDMTMSFTLRSGAMTNAAVKMDMSAEGMSMKLDMTGSDTGTRCNAVISIEDLGTISVDVTSSMTETSESPAAPAEGETVVGMEALISLLTGGVQPKAA